MLIQTLLNVATTITISANNPTTILFPEPITYAAMGKVGDFSINTNRKKTTLVFQPVRDVKNSELIVLTENYNYQFKIYVSTSNTESFFKVEKGAVNSSYVILKRTLKYEVLEGRSSYMIRNLSDEELRVNTYPIKPNSKLYLPRGSSVYVNEERVL